MGIYMKKYALIFTIAYLLITLMLVVIAGVFKVGGASLNIAATVAASFIAAWRFTQEHSRLPTTEEATSYSLIALAGIWVVSLLLVIVYFVMVMSPEESKAIMKLMTSNVFIAISIGGAIVISAIYYFAIRWSFSWFSRMACRV
jgi:hypothetical protein